MFLFDMFHEDVNRIKVKPSMSPFVFDCEIPDRDNALRFIALRKKRKDSVVEDLFGGLLKSSIRCPLCNAQSVSLDSIRVIPLSLPSDAAGCSLESCLDHFFEPEKFNYYLFACRTCYVLQKCSSNKNI